MNGHQLEEGEIPSYHHHHHHHHHSHKRHKSRNSTSHTHCHSKHDSLSQLITTSPNPLPTTTIQASPDLEEKEAISMHMISHQL